MTRQHESNKYWPYSKWRPPYDKMKCQTTGPYFGHFLTTNHADVQKHTLLVMRKKQILPTFQIEYDGECQTRRLRK